MMRYIPHKLETDLTSDIAPTSTSIALAICEERAGTAVGAETE